MEIGLFQLENICTSPTGFLFFDLSTVALDVPSEVGDLLKRANKVSAGELLGWLQGQKVPFNAPIVLVSEDGKQSESSARELEQAGFQQIYRISGGVSGLIQEFSLQ